MRIFLLLFSATVLTMCTSTKPVVEVPTDVYIVQLNTTSYPERVSKQLKQPVSKIESMRDDVGRFKFSFPVTENSNSIKKSLLNIDMVIAVWTEDEYAKMEGKKSKKSIRQNEPQKQ